MSGLEALAVLGVACNVMQIISFAGECFSVCKRICETGNPEPSLIDDGRRLTELCINLKRSLAQSSEPLTDHDKALVAIADECITAAQDLQTEIISLSA